ncbi:MAG: hypothetical protein QW667_01535 [Candidatus Bathyarchaeia archaeon]
MGFLEYAWSLFFDKDWMKTKIIFSTKFEFPQFYTDENGFVCIFPEPRVIEGDQEIISMMGYQFPADALGQRQLASLFRASAFYLSSLVLNANFGDYADWQRDKDPRLARFVSSLIEGVKATTYISLNYPDKLLDLAFANALALRKLRNIDSYLNPATKIMAGLLIKIYTGIDTVSSENELKAINYLAGLLSQFKEKVMQSFLEEKVNLKEEKLKVADEICKTIEDAGIVTEAPFLPHMPELGVCSIFHPSLLVNFDVTLEENFKKCLESLGESLSTYEGSNQTWKKIAENEAFQVIGNWKRQREKDEKLISKYQNMLLLTRFKSVEIPDPDYTEFLRVKSRSKSESHRLIESLLVARDALDEDPRKLYGVLDLQEVIQVIAGKSPRMDVFMLDENISKSYSWIILLDASQSMKHIKDFALELYLILAEAANELLLDPTSWALYAFNDRFLIIKDPKERYNIRVKSRIGGINFGGFTYMPDALTIAGEIMKTRSDKLRLITVISDGWPYGYPNINVSLTETLSTLQANMTVVGIGAASNRMSFFFKSNCAVYTLRDLTKKFSAIFVEASNTAAET